MRTQEQLEAGAARVLADGAISLSKLAKLVPTDRPGRRPHISAASLTRWIERGRRVGKIVVHLDGCRLAGKGWFCSTAALARFAAGIAAAEQGQIVHMESPAARERRVQAARDRLQQLRENWQRDRRKPT